MVKLTGTELLKLLGTLEPGIGCGGETLPTRPQGYAADHPRIELLRHKSLVLHKDYGLDEVVHTTKLLTMIRSDWPARPFADWVGGHSG